MITLIHGDNIEASRFELTRLLSLAKGKEIRELNGRGLDQNALTQALESSSLFGGDTLVVIENLFGKLGRKIKLIESLATLIRNSSSDVIVWEDKELSPSVIKSLGNCTIKLCKIPVIIFQFLDSLRPHDSKNLILLYQRVVQTQVAEITYTLLVRRVRQLIQLLDGVIPDGLAPWQATRLTGQARLFTMDKLISMHKQLLTMDIAIKTGESPFSLAQLIEQFLIYL